MADLRSLLACTAIIAVGLPAAAEAQNMSPDAANGVAKRSNCIIGVDPGGVGIFEHFDGAWRVKASAGNSLNQGFTVQTAPEFQSMLQSGAFNVSRACNTVTVTGCGNSAATGPWLPGEGETIELGGSAFATLTCQPGGGYSIVEGGDCLHDDPETAADERVTLADAGGASWSAAPNDDYIPVSGAYAGPAWSCSPGQAPSFPPIEPSSPPAFTPTPGGVTIGGGKAFRCRNAIGQPTGTVTNLAGVAGYFTMSLESPFGRVAEIGVSYNTETLQLIAYGPADPAHPARMCFNPDLEQDDFVSCDDSFNYANAPRVWGQRQNGWWAAYFTGGKGQDRCVTEDPETLEPNTLVVDGVTYSGVTYNCGSPIICAIEDE